MGECHLRAPVWRGRGSAARAELEERARALLDEFGLGDRLDAYPGELSGGMRQRVALARTLVLGRGLVLLDEPFANLDALTRGDMQQWMLRVMRTHPAAWVLVTHDVAEAVMLGGTVAVLRVVPRGLRAGRRAALSRARRRRIAAVAAGAAGDGG